MYFRSFITRKKIKLVQLADIIVNDLNIKRNDIVMVHTSFDNITLIDSQPDDFIYLLKMIVGTKGTLLMPAYSEDPPTRGSANNSKWDFIHNDRTLELFRQMPDTLQISNSSGSYAVWGGMAKNIADDHSESEDPKEVNELLYKLFQLKAKIIGIGVPLAEFISPLPGSNANNKESMGRLSGVIKNEGLNTANYPVNEYYHDKHAEILKSENYNEISKHFNDDEFKVFTKRGIPFYVVSAEKAYQIVKANASVIK